MSDLDHESLTTTGANMTVAEAPANIALIKYMGKVKDASESVNRPTNSSLSLTLPNLLTRVEIEEDLQGSKDEWQPLHHDGWQAPDLGEKGKARYLKHFAMLKDRWSLRGYFKIRSANNFPADCGLASSASSFAALTTASAQMAMKQNPNLDLTVDLIAESSRQGSGSSIRSFFKKFCIWSVEGAQDVDLGLWNLRHFVIVVDKEKKAVSSSEAHQRVLNSTLFEGRPARAELRLKNLCTAFRRRDWTEMFQICWDEFHDMHALFSTAAPPFAYMTPATHEVLKELEEVWRTRGDGPLVTMDAGPNIHVLFREDQDALQAEVMGRFATRFAVFSGDFDFREGWQ